jgi:hypothetical protein
MAAVKMDGKDKYADIAAGIACISFLIVMGSFFLTGLNKKEKHYEDIDYSEEYV